MKLDKKTTCIVCGTVLLGIAIAESGVCHKCDEMPVHIPEIFSQGPNSDSNVTLYNILSGTSSVLSEIGPTGPTGRI